MCWSTRWLTVLIKAPLAAEAENVLAYYTGHYKHDSLNVEAMSDHRGKFFTLPSLPLGALPKPIHLQWQDYSNGSMNCLIGFMLLQTMHILTHSDTVLGFAAQCSSTQLLQLLSQPTENSGRSSLRAVVFCQMKDHQEASRYMSGNVKQDLDSLYTTPQLYHRKWLATMQRSNHRSRCCWIPKQDILSKSVNIWNPSRCFLSPQQNCAILFGKWISSPFLQSASQQWLKLWSVWTSSTCLCIDSTFKVPTSTYQCGSHYTWACTTVWNMNWCCDLHNDIHAATTAAVPAALCLCT